MTQLTEQLFSTIVHDFHNGGVKSSYGLNAYTRKEILTYLLRSKGCECINCIQLIMSALSATIYLLPTNERRNKMTKWDTIQEDVKDQYAYLEEEDVYADDEDDIFGFSKSIELDHLDDEQLEEIATMLGIK